MNKPQSDADINAYDTINQNKKSRPTRFVLAITLFLLTLVSTIIAGSQWAMKIPWEIENWSFGFTYAFLIMLFLASHEFGHYIAARIHKVEVSLPYFLPMPIVFLSPFGTFGAFIRIKSPILSRKALFDIGAAGPLAGFVVCLVILIVGFINLPPIDYLYSIHPEYRFLSVLPESGMRFGDTIMLSGLKHIFASKYGFMPPMNEIYHYPFLCVGWFGMFVTALNMLPFGQLDGGHVLYAMFGKHQRRIAATVWWLIVVLGMGWIFGELRLALRNDSPDELYTMLQTTFSPIFEALYRFAPWYFNAWNGWLFWALIGRFFVKLPHPPIADPNKLDKRRMALGWAALVAFAVSFSYNGIIMDLGGADDSPTQKGAKLVEFITRK